jgi:DNA-directed RNA polymerase subunit RPC12/RpoP
MVPTASSLNSSRRSIEIQWRCLKCGRANEDRPAPPGVGPWKCVGCGATAPAQPNALDAEGRLRACPACGCPDLYRHRDFNRKLGLAIVVAGAIAAWFVGFWVLLAFIAVDFAIYHAVGDVAVCYHCHAILRGYPGIDAVEPFDLNVSDKYIEVERERGW